MVYSTKLVVLLGIYLITMTEVFAQNPSRTIIRNRAEYKWLNKHGFDVASYDWRHDETNLQLRKALRKRRTSGKWLEIGGAIVGLVGGTAATIILIAPPANQDTRSNPGFAEYAVFSTLAFTITGLPAIAKSNKAKKHVKSARLLRGDN